MKYTLSIFLFLSITIGMVAQNSEVRLALTFHDTLSTKVKRSFCIQSFNPVADTSMIAKSCKLLKRIQTASIQIYPTASFNAWNHSYRNSVRLVKGVDKNGKNQIMFDTNNNGDFSDEQVFIPDTITDQPKTTFNKSSFVKLEYDWAVKGQKVKRQLSLQVLYLANRDLYLYTYAHHATATLDGKALEIITLNTLDYIEFEVFDIAKNDIDGVRVNGFLIGGNEVYRIKEIDINTNELVLVKELRKLSEIESAQVGFRPPTFSAIDFNTKELVSLEKYRGKYVYLDLFSTGCGPCIRELPELKKIYDTVDRSKIEFIGIVQADKPERIAAMVQNSGLNWPLIEANHDNHIFRKYQVSAVPTTLLLDPNGIVIKTGLRANKLKQFIDNGFRDVDN